MESERPSINHIFYALDLDFLEIVVGLVSTTNYLCFFLGIRTACYEIDE